MDPVSEPFVIETSVMFESISQKRTQQNSQEYARTRLSHEFTSHQSPQKDLNSLTTSLMTSLFSIKQKYQYKRFL